MQLANVMQTYVAYENACDAALPANIWAQQRYDVSHFEPELGQLRFVTELTVINYTFLRNCIEIYLFTRTLLV